MKFQILFVSLLTTANTHARYEPKGLLRLRGGDDRDLELETHLPIKTIRYGYSATVECRSGSKCCVLGNSSGIVGPHDISIGGDPCSGYGVSHGNDAPTIISNGRTKCNSEKCQFSCDEGCTVSDQNGSVGEKVEDGKDSSSRQPVPPRKPISWPYPPRTNPIAPRNNGGNTSLHPVTEGKSATIQCGLQQFRHCCVPKASFKEVPTIFPGGGSCPGDSATVAIGSANNCKEKQCVISCDEGCEVHVQDSSVSGHDGTDSSSRQPLLPPTPFPQPSPSRTIPIPPSSGGNTSAMRTTRVAEGQTATISCSAAMCCVKGLHFRRGIMQGGSNCNGDGYAMVGKAICTRGRDDCTVTCPPSCDVQIKEGDDGKDSSSRQPLLPPTPFSQPQPSPSRPIPPFFAPFLPHNSGESTAGKKNDSVIDRGQSVTIQCSSGSHCCVTGGSFGLTTGHGQQVSLGHDLTNTMCSGGITTTISNGSARNCKDKQCVVSCDEGCKVDLQEAARTIPVAPPTSSGTTIVAILLAVPLQVTLLLALI